VRESFESIYKDRVVVNDYIFRLARIIQIKNAVIRQERADSLSRHGDHNYDSIDFILEKYATTKFTEKEIIYFRKLKKEIQDFRTLELSLAAINNAKDREQTVAELNQTAHTILLDLDTLSEIQVAESKVLFESSNQRMYTSHLNAQLELVFLIVIGAIILMLMAVTPFHYSLKKRLSDLN
jgi:hypothetical protein